MKEATLSNWFSVHTKEPVLERVPSRTSTAGEEKSLPSFKVSKDGLTFSLRPNADDGFQLIQCSFAILNILRPLDLR